MSALWSIAYLSTARFLHDAAQLETLLAASRDYNRARDVTGALLVHDMTFFQYLEGPRDGVMDVYERVRASGRHGGLIELVNRPVGARQFGDWYMGCAEVPNSLLLRLEKAQWNAAAGDVAHTRSEGAELLLEFWRNARRFG